VRRWSYAGSLYHSETVQSTCSSVRYSLPNHRVEVAGQLLNHIVPWQNVIITMSETLWTGTVVHRRPMSTSHNRRLCSRQRLRFATRGDLVVSSPVTHFGTRAFAVAGPKAWNQLQMHTGVRESVGSFKTALKTHFHFVD